MAKRLIDKISLEKWAILLSDIKARAGEQWGPNAKFSNEEVVSVIKEFVRANDRLPTSSELKKRVLGFSDSFFYIRCGNMENVRNILGIPKDDKKKKKKKAKKKNKAKNKNVRETKIAYMVDSSKKDEYLEAFCILAEEKGVWEFTLDELKKGFNDLIGEYDENVVKHFWGNAMKFMAEAKSRVAAETPMLDTREELVDYNKKNEETAFQEGTAPFWEETGEVVTPPNEVFTSSVNNVVKITIEVSKDMKITEILESILRFTDNVVIRVVD